LRNRPAKEDFHNIAKCADAERMMQAIYHLSGRGCSLCIVAASGWDCCGEYWSRRVAREDTWILAIAEVPDDMVGTRVCAPRLTPKEMRIVALIVQGCKNREIASRLKTTEQVMKELSGLHLQQDRGSDRLELALFTIH
jgi:DNA-binding NarL/FixJ family response regulator